MIIWRTGHVAGDTIGYFRITSKVFSLAAALRDRWLLWDSFSVGVAVVLIGSAIFDQHLEISRKLGIPAIILFAIFLILPWEVFGSAYADMRLAPFMLMVALIGIKLSANAGPTVRHRLVGLGMAFMIFRLGGNMVSFILADREIKSELNALDYIPEHSRVLSLVGNPCGLEWAMPRYSHLGSFVITRKLGFSNDQWQLPGAQLLAVKYSAARQFRADPSELTFTKECQRHALATLPIGSAVAPTTDEDLELFPRKAFDFVWLIRPSGFSYHLGPEFSLVWRGQQSVLYRLDYPSEKRTR